MNEFSVQKSFFLENSRGFRPSESGRSEKASSEFLWEPADYQPEKGFYITER